MVPAPAAAAVAVEAWTQGFHLIYLFLDASISAETATAAVTVSA